MKLLDECNRFNYEVEVIKETTQTGKEKESIYLKGVIQRADTVNQNGRIYPRDVLEREVKNYQKLIREKRAYGSLDHTDSSVIEFQTVSHIMTEVYMDDDGVVYGKLKILPTDPHGKNVLTFIDEGTTIGISSRGVGSTERDRDGYNVVQNDFQLICWDLVTEPSTPGAFVMKEGREISAQEMKEINNFFNQSDRIDRALNDILGWDKEDDK